MIASANCCLFLRAKDKGLGFCGPATGVIWALRAQSWKKNPKMSSQALSIPRPKKSKTESNKSQHRLFFNYLDSFRLRFRVLGAAGLRGPGTHFRTLFPTLGPEGPNDICSWQKLAAGPKRGSLKSAGKRQESATFLQHSLFNVAVQFFVCCSTTVTTFAAQLPESCSATSVFACGMLQGWGLQGWGLGLANSGLEHSPSQGPLKGPDTPP